jgi:hypothetical protein
LYLLTEGRFSYPQKEPLPSFRRSLVGDIDVSSGSASYPPDIVYGIGVAGPSVQANGVSENGVSENSVQANGVSENGVSENSVSENSVQANGVSGSAQHGSVEEPTEPAKNNPRNKIIEEDLGQHIDVTA